MTANAIGALIGRQAGGAYNTLQAIRKAAGGGDGMTVIPLDLITGVWTTKSRGFGGLWETQTLVVTTADGTEYGFHGKMAGWQTDLASALAGRDRDVRATPQGTTVTPQATPTDD